MSITEDDFILSPPVYATARHYPDAQGLAVAQQMINSIGSDVLNQITVLCCLHLFTTLLHVIGKL